MTWHAILDNYNAEAAKNGWQPYVYVHATFNTTCTVVGILGATYGKYMNRNIEGTVIMEYENFLPFLLPFLPVTNNTDFNSYLSDNPLLLEQYADFLMYTLPNPRYNYYESPNF